MIDSLVFQRRSSKQACILSNVAVTVTSEFGKMWVETPPMFCIWTEVTRILSKDNHQPPGLKESWTNVTRILSEDSHQPPGLK
jgi:hypothetical protein